MDFKRATSSSQRNYRKQQIISSTVELFFEEGICNITYAKIAERADLKRTIIYTYYSNIADILLDYLMFKLSDYIAEFNSTDFHGKDPLLVISKRINDDTNFTSILSISTSILENVASNTFIMRYKRVIQNFKHNVELLYIEYDHNISHEDFNKKYSIFAIVLMGTWSIKSGSYIDGSEMLGLGCNKFEEMDLLEIISNAISGVKHENL